MNKVDDTADNVSVRFHRRIIHLPQVRLSVADRLMTSSCSLIHTTARMSMARGAHIQAIGSQLRSSRVETHVLPKIRLDGPATH